MRDDRDIVTSNAWITTRTSGAIDSSGSYSHNSLRTYRDNAMSTLYIPGKGYIAPTPYRAFFFTSASNAYSYRFNFPGIGLMQTDGQSATTQAYPTPNMRYLCNTFWPHDPVPNLGLISSLESEVNAKIKGKAWNLAQSLGELPETARFVLSVAKRVMDAYRSLRRGDIGRFVRNLSLSARDQRYLTSRYAKKGSTFAKLWLEYKFAWLPLLSDIFNAVNLMKTALRKPGSFYSKADRTEGSLPLPAPWTTINVSSHTGHVERGARVGVNYSVDNPFLATLDAMGLLDPLSLAWELLPLSFVIDWFIPIGNFLQALSSPIGLTFHSGYKTTWVKWSAEITYLPTFAAANFRGGSRPSLRTRLFSSKRDIYLSFPIPLPYFRGFGNLGGDKLLTLAALTR